MLRGTAKLLPPLPKPEVKRERLVEVLGAARASRSKHVNRAFLSGLLVLFSTEEPRERICGGQGAEGAKPRGVPNAGLGHDVMMTAYTLFFPFKIKEEMSSHTSTRISSRSYPIFYLE